MKKLVSIIALSFCFSGLNQAAFAHTVNVVDLQMQAALFVPADLINWTVGDTAEYEVSAGAFGKVGKMVKSVTKDEGQALWVKQDMDMQIQKELIEILIRKSDGKILKMLRNGQEQAVPDQSIEIISQDYTEITVPAGKFKVLHIIAKSKEISKIELWANPKDTVMDGAIKQSISTGFVDISMELSSFKHGNK